MKKVTKNISAVQYCVENVRKRFKGLENKVDTKYLEGVRDTLEMIIDEEKALTNKINKKELRTVTKNKTIDEYRDNLIKSIF